MAGEESMMPGFPSQCPWVPLDVCSLQPAMPMPMPMARRPCLSFPWAELPLTWVAVGCPEVLLGAAVLSLFPTPTLLLLLYLGQEEVFRMGAADSNPHAPHSPTSLPHQPQLPGADLVGATLTRPS